MTSLKMRGFHYTISFIQSSLKIGEMSVCSNIKPTFRRFIWILTQPFCSLLSQFFGMFFGDMEKMEFGTSPMTPGMHCCKLCRAYFPFVVIFSKRRISSCLRYRGVKLKESSLFARAKGTWLYGNCDWPRGCIRYWTMYRKYDPNWEWRM